MFAFILIISIIVFWIIGSWLEWPFMKSMSLTQLVSESSKLSNKIMNDPEIKNKKIHIYIVGREFSKSKLIISIGDTIIFNNKDIVRHQIINDHGSIPNSSLLYPGDSFEIICRKPGSYTFYSPLYNEMNHCDVFVQ